MTYRTKHSCLLREAESSLALLLLHSKSIHSEESGMGVAHWQLCFCSRVTTYLFWPLYLLWLLVGGRVEVEEAQHGLRRGTPHLARFGAKATRRVPAVLGPVDRRRGR